MNGAEITSGPGRLSSRYQFAYHSINNAIVVIVSDIPTALLSESQLRSVERMHHVLHMHMHPYLLSPNVSDGGCRYSVPCGYCISIS